MFEFLEFVLWKLQSGLVLVLCTFALAGGVLGVDYWRRKRKFEGEITFPWKKALLWILLLGYLVIVLYATLLRWHGGYRQWNLHLFRAWREAWNNFSAKSWANVLLNIAMFMPLGFLLPLMSKKFRRWYVTIPAGIGASALIELVQLLLNRGICDVDDLFCNGLGSMIGYFAVMAVLSAFHEKGKRLGSVLRYGALALTPFLAVGCIFGIYHFKEYGNLPKAAAFRVDLGHLDWKLECSLPELDGAVPVYRTQTMSRADCDDLAEKMAALSGQEIAMVSYYQEMAYYNLSRDIMMVNYYDGSYEFGWFDYDQPLGNDADRQTVETALLPYSITVPEAARFQRQEDGAYSFTCDEYRSGSELLDGTLEVQLGTDGTACWIHNGLISYTHHADIPVISAGEAYELLRAGEFYDAESLKRYSYDCVTVTSCVLDYEIDTKGFYQPVYRFELLIPETGNTCLAMIGAMK